ENDVRGSHGRMGILAAMVTGLP
ncbi:MAG: hypothetical protein JWM80_67, partial [Cyanobacteria bacterium RYN_339]|nr:hypothetical protein [Cyanobacteria bacterium RYN_339]